VFRDGWQEGLVHQLDASVRERLCAAGQLGLTVPNHQALWYTLIMVPFPVIVAPLAAHDGMNGFADDVSLAISDRTAVPSVVRIAGNQWEMLSEGAVSQSDLKAQSRCSIVFICTGNTCRSPMAAALCRQLLAQRLGCQVDELAERGYEVNSAGIAALAGEPAAAEAIDTVRELGGDLTQHASQPLTAELARHADYLITMTQGHQTAILGHFPYSVQPRTLCPKGTDIADPIGAGPEVYRRCGQDILRHLEHWIAELEAPCA
jgi:protein arginine phosphatase